MARGLSSERLTRWRMLIEEYDCTIQHIPGKDNIVADGLSLLETDFDSETEYPNSSEDEQGVFSAYCIANMEALDDEEYLFSNQLSASKLANCLACENETMETYFPIYPPLIKKYQDEDRQLKTLIKKNSKDFSTKKIENQNLIMYRDKIFMSRRLQSRVVAWHHEYLQHPGKKRTEETIRQWFHWPGIRHEVRTFCKTCELCQVSKKQQKKYG